MADTRSETDLLGTIEVPADAYYGVHTVRAIENYQISGRTISDVPEFVRGMVQVKKACAMANEELKVLPHDIAQAIISACDEILETGKAMDQFPSDLFQGGAGTSTNMNTNEVIANLALEKAGFEKGRYDVINPNDHVNKSQSTNDAYPTGLKLAAYALAQQLAEEIDKLNVLILEKAEEFKDVLKMGRTQLQDAVPMTLGQEFHGFASNLREESDIVRRCANNMLSVNLGGTAIGTGLNTPVGFAEKAAEKLAEVTGLPVTSAPDLIEANSDTGSYVLMHSAIKRFATKLSKICSDLRLLSSGPRAGINEINLPERAAGSSIMPAKVNPVIPEVVNQVCFKVIGNDVTVTIAAEAGQLQLNVMEPVIAQSLFESLSLLTRAVDALGKKCIEGITANKKHAYDQVMSSIGIVTYLNEVIGHANGDLIGKTAAQNGKTVREIAIELGLITEEQADIYLSEDALKKDHYFGKTYEDDEKGLPEC